MIFHIDTPYLNYLLDIINDIEESLKKVSKDKFLKNKDIRDANIRRLEIIGNTIENLSEKIKIKYKDILWNKILDIKKETNKHYFGIDFEILFEVLEKEIPILKEQILKIKEEIKKEVSRLAKEFPIYEKFKY